MEPEIKEVQMDVPVGKGKRRARRTRKGSAVPEEDAIVEKTPAKVPAMAPANAKESSTKESTKESSSSTKEPSKDSKPAPKVVIAPPKKKPTRILLVPCKAVASSNSKRSTLVRKTYTAKRVRLVIDNSAKTVKKRRQTLQKIDALTDEQVRQACLDAKLSRKETVAKVPIALLRQMLKDYQIMRGSLL